MILSSALRKKMEELFLDFVKSRTPDVTNFSISEMCKQSFGGGFTAAVDELTKVPEDAGRKIEIESKKHSEYDDGQGRCYNSMANNSFISGSHFFKSEIMPSIIEQARRNAIKECIKALEEMRIWTIGRPLTPKITASLLRDKFLKENEE